MAEESIKLYGTDWCPKTATLKNFFQAEWIDFEYFNVDTDDEAKEELKDIYDGKVKFPTLTKGGKHLKNPSVGDVRKFLKD